MDMPKLRDTPGGGLEVLDDDGVWRTVPFAVHGFFKSFRPDEGFTIWEWMIGQVYAAGTFPKGGLGPNTTQDDFDMSVRFRDACRERFPDETDKFARHMGWKKN